MLCRCGRSLHNKLDRLRSCALFNHARNDQENTLPKNHCQAVKRGANSHKECLLLFIKGIHIEAIGSDVMGRGE